MSEESRPRGPWCPIHKCHPNKCFEIHYPDSTRGNPVDYEAYADSLVQEKVQRQNENIRRRQQEMSKDVIDARKRFKRGA